MTQTTTSTTTTTAMMMTMLLMTLLIFSLEAKLIKIGPKHCQTVWIFFFSFFILNKSSRQNFRQFELFCLQGSQTLTINQQQKYIKSFKLKTESVSGTSVAKHYTDAHMFTFPCAHISIKTCRFSTASGTPQ